MLINKISQAMQGELRKIDGSRKSGNEPSAAKAVVSDRSELSLDGKKQREVKGDMQIISSMIKAQPDIRAERVAEVRARVDSGFYNTMSFADKLAEKLVGVVA